MGRSSTLEVVITAKDRLSKVLGKTEKNLTRLGKSGTHLGKTFQRSTAHLTKLKGRLSDVDREIHTLQGRRLRLEDDFRSGAISAEKFKHKLSLIDRKEAALNSRKLRLSRDLDRSSAEAAKLERHLRAVERRTKAINALNRFDVSAHKIGGSLQRTGLKTMGAGVAAGMGIGKLVGSYEDVARAKGEIASLGIDKRGIAIVAREGRKYSNKYAGTTQADFIRASYDIKSGIASLTDSGVAEMTRYAAITGAATKSNTAQMTKLFALGHGIFRTQFKSDTDFGQKFSAAISGAVKAFRTDGNDLVSGLSTLGAVATKSGYSLQEQLSVLGVSKGAFNTASEAATSYRAFINGAGKAQKELGLKFTDAKGHLLGMPKILEKIKHKYKDLSKKSVQDKLKKAFGSDEAIKLIMALIDKTDDLKRARDDLNTKMDRGIAVSEEMAQKMQQGKELEIARQQAANLASTLGGFLAPSVIKIADKMGQAAIALQRWIDHNKETAHWLGKVVTYGTLGAVALGGTALAAGTLLKATKLVTSPLRGLTRFLGGTAKAAGKTSGTLCDIGGCAAGSSKELTQLGGTVKKTRGIFAGGLTLSVALIGGAAVVAGLRKIAKDSKKLIDNKHSITPTKQNTQKLRQKEKDLKNIIAASEGTYWGHLKEGIVSLGKHFYYSGLQGIDSKEEIKAQKKLLRRTQRNLTISTTMGAYKPPIVREDPVYTPEQIAKAKAYSDLMHSLHPSPNDLSNLGGANLKTAAGAGTDIRGALSGALQPLTGTLKSQYGALQSTVSALANRPEQHTYHVSVVVNNAKSDQDVEAAVNRALRNSHAQKQERTLNDL